MKGKIIRLVIVLLLITSVSLFYPPQETNAAETKTWIGGDGNWSDGSNWSPAGVPSGIDEIIIDDDIQTGSDVTLDIDFTLHGSIYIERGDRVQPV